MRIRKWPVVCLTCFTFLFFCCGTRNVETPNEEVKETNQPAAKLGNPFGFDHALFSKRKQLANWLMDYDRVAWQASDVVLAEPEEVRRRLGREWFCYQNNDKEWLAVFGKYHADSNEYERVRGYLVKTGQTITETDELPSQTSSITRALNHAIEKMFPEFGRVRMNTYVRLNGDDGIDIWFLPAGQPNGVLVFGKEFRLSYSADGRELLDEFSCGREFRGVRPKDDMELEILQPDQDIPSVGAIFFATYFRKRFECVYIRTGKFLSRFVEAKTGACWIHAAIPVDDGDRIEPEQDQ